MKARNVNNYNIIPYKTRMKKYCYAGNTSQIVEVSSSLYDKILAGDTEALTIFKNKYPAILSANLIDRVVSGYNLEEIDLYVNNRLRSMTLGVTNECNMRCRYCVYSGRFPTYRAHSRNKMSKEVALKAADYFLAHISDDDTQKSFSFYGGEPLLNFELIKDTIDYIKPKTNNVLLTSPKEGLSPRL